MIRKLELPKYDVSGRRVRGKQEIVQLVPARNPFVKKQLIEATIILEPATFTKKAVVKKEVFHADFMSAIRMAQEKYPKKSISYRSVDTRPDWLKKQQEEEAACKKAESKKSTDNVQG